MTTREIAQHLARAAKGFSFLGRIEAEDLLEVVRRELGHEEILDGFQPYGKHCAMAVGPRILLHVMSGNTPHAGLQSLIRGLLLRAHNLCKIPSDGLPEIGRFRDALPDLLAGRIEIATELPPEWMRRAEAVIVFGDDATISHFAGLIRPGQRFAGHGHKLSLGLIFDDPQLESVAASARDASLFDQQGCLSPHAFYVRKTQARAYAEKLALEMEAFNRQTPRGPLSPAEAAAIGAVRDRFEFLAANKPGIAVWKSAQTTDWTVILDDDPAFTPSCLNRVIFVKPLPENLSGALEKIRPHLAAVAVWPLNNEKARIAAGLGAERICAPGRMQFPPFTWHQDGCQTLAPLVRWVDFESGGDET